jgi:hypothetical protein
VRPRTALSRFVAKQGPSEGLVCQVWYYAAALAETRAIDMAKQRPKDKGTKAETDVVLWAKKHGMYQAERLVLHGTGDIGDVRLTQDVMAQVKDGYTERKEPTDYQVGQWLEQVDKQRNAGGWDIALLVHKRYGKADPDMWRWYMDGATFACLMHVNIPMESGVTWPQYVQLMGYMIPDMIQGWSTR